MKKRDDDANLSCSFCGKSQREVKKMIAGPTVYICDECIELCNDIIAEEVLGLDHREQIAHAPILVALDLGAEAHARPPHP